MQQPDVLAACEGVIGGGRLGQRPVERSGDDRVDDRIDVLDPLDVRGYHLARRHLASAQHAGEGDGVSVAKVTVAKITVAKITVAEVGAAQIGHAVSLS